MQKNKHEASNADSRSALAQVNLVKLCLLSVNFRQHLWVSPLDNLSQIRLTDKKDQTSCSVWVGLINFAKIAFYKQNSISKCQERNAILLNARKESVL